MEFSKVPLKSDLEKEEEESLWVVNTGYSCGVQKRTGVSYWALEKQNKINDEKYDMRK